MKTNGMNTYASRVLDQVKAKYCWEKEFILSVEEVFRSISPVLDQQSLYEHYAILERVTEPERVITFRVPWLNDQQRIQVNTGYRVQFSSVLGPYKGGLRFHASVNPSIMKMLAFEQVFKNALTGLPMGGAKGGSDFSPRGKSDTEIMKFCQSFMTELSRHIGPNVDVPAGDIGVGTREVGYLFGQYRRINNVFNGCLTGKALLWGGSPLRPEATGYGVVYFTERMLRTAGQELEGKIVAVSGFGNVAWGVVRKINELGGTVVTLSGPDGFVYDPDGIKGEKIDYMLKMRYDARDIVKEYSDKYKVAFFPGKKPWGVKCDIAIPCATEHELDDKDADDLLNNGVQCVTEAANFPCSPKAMEKFVNSNILYASGKAANAGGVACSGLEMAQNSMRMNLLVDEIDRRLKEVMNSIHDGCREVSDEYGSPGNYVLGANILGFERVAEAMIDQGIT